METKLAKPESAKSEDHKPAAIIDLRSDTVTKPTPEMRRAMAEAEVGDDVYGEDPTVNRLEARAAEIFEREAAIFVPTGTMGNQIAIKIHTRHGQEIICEERAHIINLESATRSEEHTSELQSQSNLVCRLLLEKKKKKKMKIKSIIRIQKISKS